jgi:hypothetical protein
MFVRTYTTHVDTLVFALLSSRMQRSAVPADDLPGQQNSLLFQMHRNAI